MMALHVGLRRASALAAIVGFSGRLCLSPNSGLASLQAELRSKPPVFLAHGDQDPVVPFNSLEKARDALETLGVPHQEYVEQGLGHGINMDAMQKAALFLKNILI